MASRSSAARLGHKGHLQDGQRQMLSLQGDAARAFGTRCSMNISEMTAVDVKNKIRKERTHPITTDLRNLVALSTTSSHTEDTVLSSKSEASGRARRASRDSCNSSLQRSASSPGHTQGSEEAAPCPRSSDEQSRPSPGGKQMLLLFHLTLTFSWKTALLKAMKYRSKMTSLCWSLRAERVVVADWTATCWIRLLGPIHGYQKKGSTTNPEAYMNISEIISYWGYPYEEYDVITTDGYILGIYRIPYKRRCSRTAPKPVVYLQHVLIASASKWICNLPNSSLAFLLADSGYDVWMGNSRGNSWSRKYLKFSPESPEYWAFSMDEMAKYDLLAMTYFTIEKTGQEQLYYVGHSQGTTITFIAFSTIPELAKRIKIFFALAPIITVKYTQSPLKKLTDLSRKIVKLLLGDRMFYPHTCFDQFIATKVCNQKLFRRICSNFLFILNGFDPKNLNMSCLDVYLAQISAGTSAQNIQHRAQAANSGGECISEKFLRLQCGECSGKADMGAGWGVQLHSTAHGDPSPSSLPASTGLLQPGLCYLSTPDLSSTPRSWAQEHRAWAAKQKESEGIFPLASSQLVRPANEREMLKT
ncbi:hypothetical protein MC885_004364 [Smutsia gigantea]|nr:hypothetical protein MC885_004364 [Smutsia gigantea]